MGAGLDGLATGSDGAGSIRIPSAFTGLVGVKPSCGLIPSWPTRDSLTVRGPLTRTVMDAALMLDALAGPDRRDPSSIDGPPPDFVAAIRRDPGRLKVAWSPDFGHVTVAPDVADACRRAAQQLADLGCEVIEVPITWGPRSVEIMEPIWATQLAEAFDDRIDEHPEWVEPSLHRFARAGQQLTAVAHERALVGRVELYDQLRSLFDEYELLLSPTMPDTAW